VSFAAVWLIMMIIALGIAAVKIEKITRDPRWAGRPARRRRMRLGIAVVLTTAVLVPPVVIFLAAADGLLSLAIDWGPGR
jgi:hypothetical protein